MLASAPAVGSGLGGMKVRSVLLGVALVAILLLALDGEEGSSLGGLAGLLLRRSAPSVAVANRPALHGEPLTAVSWNIAAINNNPFEYWVEMSDPAYNKLMAGSQRFVDNPGHRDVEVRDVFTDSMFQELKRLMLAKGWRGVAETEGIWRSSLSGKRIVSGFLKDKSIGKKRLTSMPDRMTNTVRLPPLPGSTATTQGVGGSTVYRPTPINCYEGELASPAQWWSKWRAYMFETPLRTRARARMHGGGSGGGKAKAKAKANGKVRGQAEAGTETVRGASSLLSPIKRAKYPALTEVEEQISLPLQTLHLAVFDAILVRMLNQQTSPQAWHKLRLDVCAALNRNKFENVARILEAQYAPTAHLIFLQEAASAFVEQMRAGPLGGTFHVLASEHMNTKRDQNSVILARKDTFADPGEQRRSHYLERTDGVMARLKATGKKVPVSNGDVLAVELMDLSGRRYALASFHGDTNGLATIPVVRAVQAEVQASVGVGDSTSDVYDAPALVFGLDANTHVTESRTGKGKSSQGVREFVADFTALGLSSCWAAEAGAAAAGAAAGAAQLPQITTHNARTYIQPQLQKASAREEVATKGDVNPKDFILFPADRFVVAAGSTVRDNTGSRRFTDGTLFPTLTFPSDHALIETTLQPVSQ